jgi:GNAT superfamily N-acetyltransferase
MNSDDVRLAVSWAAAEGWNPGEHDAECFHAADLNGFFIGKLNGEPIGCISAVKYEGEFGFVGLYIVRPEYRGKGYGIALWNKAMEYIEGCNAALDGVVAQQENYKKSGFILAHRNIRYELHENSKSIINDKNVIDIKDIEFSRISEYDKRHFLYERDVFLVKWLTQKNAASRVYISGDDVQGYGVIRKCGVGYKIGPLFADTPEIAEVLFNSLIATTNDEPVYLDIPEVNPNAVSLVERYSMKKVFDTARMYTKGDPGLPLENIYGITTFELG